MTTHRMRGALAAAALLLVCVLPALIGSSADAEPAAPTAAAALAETKALLASGQAAAALAILRTLPRDGEQRIEVLFQTGLAALAAAERADLSKTARRALYNEAAIAFLTILINRPELVRVRLELARAFFLKGQDGLARRHFELVLAGGPPPAVAANIRRFLAVMRDRKRFTGYFRRRLCAGQQPQRRLGERDRLY